jgi:hypothetical protein
MLPQLVGCDCRVKILRRKVWLKRLLLQKLKGNLNSRFVLTIVVPYVAGREVLSEKQVSAEYVSESLHRQEDFRV